MIGTERVKQSHSAKLDPDLELGPLKTYKSDNLSYHLAFDWLFLFVLI